MCVVTAESSTWHRTRCGSANHSHMACTNGLWPPWPASNTRLAGIEPNTAIHPGQSVGVNCSMSVFMSTSPVMRASLLVEESGFLKTDQAEFVWLLCECARETTACKPAHASIHFVQWPPCSSAAFASFAHSDLNASCVKFCWKLDGTSASPRTIIFRGFCFLSFSRQQSQKDKIRPVCLNTQLRRSRIQLNETHAASACLTISSSERS
mmetsp:Transcript_58617/g.85931  ORF Transcript_58617/g.85931 Transcript_58617/m.85931 type:complete len:209 (-) Transcript_58617:732-1358(-)